MVDGFICLFHHFKHMYLCHFQCFCLLELFQGWYIVTYGLGIYHLNLFIAFLTPKLDPAMDFDGIDWNIEFCNKFFFIFCL